MKPTYTLTVTEADLDKAIAAREAAHRRGLRFDSCDQCLFAQAATRQEGKPMRVPLSVQTNAGRFVIGHNTPARRLMDLFDAELDVRAQLPVTFELSAE